METLLLLIDSVAMVLVLFYSRKNDKLEDGAPQTGFFRFSQAPAAKPAPSARVRDRGRR